MSSDLYILHICHPKYGWQPPRIFSQANINKLDEEERTARTAGDTVITTIIHGNAVEPLREWFLSNPK